MSADPPRNFTISTEERIRAMTIEVPAWAARKRQIEDAEDRWVKRLVEVHDDRVSKDRKNEAADAMAALAQRFVLAPINELVARHNRYYPIEANLAMSRNGYLAYGRPWKPEQPYTVERLLALANAFIAKRESS
jgi:hypothetical protein